MRRKKNLLQINNREFIDSAILNDMTFRDYYERMKKICLSIFEWSNLPTSMDARYLEQTLFEDGQASLLKDKTLGLINTRCADNGYLSIYALPVRVNCYSINYRTFRNVYTGFKNEDLNEDNQTVLVLNNYSRIPTSTTIMLFALRLYEAQRTCDVNIKSQKFPILLLGNEKQQLTLKNLYNQYDGNQPVIYGDPDILSADMIKSIDTKSPYVADKIQDYKRSIWNEFLEFIGVNSINVEKKERLVTSEADSNNEVTNLNLQAFLVPRQKACDEFNELFGLEGDNKISVRVRSDLFNIIKQEESVITDYNMNITDEMVGDNNE